MRYDTFQGWRTQPTFTKALGDMLFNTHITRIGMDTITDKDILMSEGDTNKEHVVSSKVKTNSHEEE